MSIQIDNFHKLNSKQRKFILNNDDVLTDLVKTNMSSFRFNHTLGVAKLAKELAICHHVDPYKAWLAGMLHDIAKDINGDERDLYLKYYDIELMDEPEPIKHSHVAKYYLKEKLHIHDKDVLNAIYNHTVLKTEDKLSLILYISDKREESREIYDNVVDVARTDLKKARDMLFEEFKIRKSKENGN